MTDPDIFVFADDGGVPNSRLPLLVYRQAVPADAAAIERIFTANQWPAAWRAPVFPYHHFHSDAHEVLGVAQGESRVQFGGPQGQVLTVRAGDVVVVPAGVGHCRQSQSDGLVIVGAYPANTAMRDLRRGNPAEHDDVVRNIAAVPLPPADPVAGDDGPLLRLWAA
ncbi:MAG TPA: cupin domain-containing protein [Acetobacteraceae bacterium]|nr:cupin domain-containing protein [Acetobacteraceae bacterium]